MKEKGRSESSPAWLLAGVLHKHDPSVRLHWLTNLLQYEKMLTVGESGSNTYRNIPESVRNFSLNGTIFQTSKIM